MFLTHIHADHSGLVNDFVAHGATMYMHSIDYQYLQDGADDSEWHETENRYIREGIPADIIKQQRKNQARAFSADPHFPAVLLNGGETLHFANQDIYVIHTPGHTKGLCCLYLPKQKSYFLVIMYYLILHPILLLGVICNMYCKYI